MARTLQPLHELQMASPCSADWEQMPGTERVRRCHKCRLNVYRVSDLTREEAEEVVETHEGHACRYLYRRLDGTVLVQDCPKGVAALRKASRWWKERMFHLFMLLIPWMILTGFIYLDTDRQRNGSYDIWGEEPFRTLDELFGTGPATAPAGVRTMTTSMPPPAIGVDIGPEWEGPALPDDPIINLPPGGLPPPPVPRR